MQFTGKLSELDLRDVRKTARTRMYWPKILLRNWYAIGLLVAVIWGTVAGLLGYTKPNWKGLAIVWAVIAAIILWVIYRAKRAGAKELVKLNAGLPDQINLTNEGVKLDGPNGTAAFLPW